MDTELEDMQLEFERVNAAAIVADKRAQNFDKVCPPSSILHPPSSILHPPSSILHHPSYILPPPSSRCWESGS
jgi:hypothetical protein